MIPTKDRPELLARCLERVLAACDATGRRCEVVVVDDGSTPPVAALERPPGARRAHRGRRARRGRATSGSSTRSRRSSRSPTTTSRSTRGWLAAALAVLDADASLAGVTGRTDAPPFDPLYEHAVFDHDGGSFLTCNVAYRAAALRAVGGFDRQFPHAAHEDRDLAWRVRDAVGEVRFVEAMRVVHPGRPFTRRTVGPSRAARRRRLAAAAPVPCREGVAAARAASRRSRRWRDGGARSREGERGIDRSPRRARAVVAARRPASSPSARG